MTAWKNSRASTAAGEVGASLPSLPTISWPQAARGTAQVKKEAMIQLEVPKTRLAGLGSCALAVKGRASSRSFCQVHSLRA